MNVGRVYIGWDKREALAYAVAVKTLTARSSIPLDIEPLVLEELERQELMTRPRGRKNGQLYDFISGAPMSTEFAITRFLVPILCRRGWALFIDCDVVVLADIAELFALADDRYAVMCVQHPHLAGDAVKMDGQEQTYYSRKNWSSVVLFNCAHWKNHRLDLHSVNRWPGRDLHAFSWLEDRDIGALPAEWNWLVGVQAAPLQPKLAHFTLGGPWLPGWNRKPHDDLWLSASDD